ncbi:hypothetical protein JCM11251_003582 [Rhodosporidiobolus azoricus]
MVDYQQPSSSSSSAVAAPLSASRLAALDSMGGRFEEVLHAVRSLEEQLVKRLPKNAKPKGPLLPKPAAPNGTAAGTSAPTTQGTTSSSTATSFPPSASSSTAANPPRPTVSVQPVPLFRREFTQSREQLPPPARTSSAASTPQQPQRQPSPEDIKPRIPPSPTLPRPRTATPAAAAPATTAAMIAASAGKRASIEQDANGDESDHAPPPAKKKRFDGVPNGQIDSETIAAASSSAGGQAKEAAGQFPSESSVAGGAAAGAGGRKQNKKKRKSQAAQEEAAKQPEGSAAGQQALAQKSQGSSQPPSRPSSAGTTYTSLPPQSAVFGGFALGSATPNRGVAGAPRPNGLPAFVAAGEASALSEAALKQQVRDSILRRKSATPQPLINNNVAPPAAPSAAPAPASTTLTVPPVASKFSTPAPLYPAGSAARKATEAAAGHRPATATKDPMKALEEGLLQPPLPPPQLRRPPISPVDHARLACPRDPGVAVAVGDGMVLAEAQQEEAQLEEPPYFAVSSPPLTAVPAWKSNSADDLVPGRHRWTCRRLLHDEDVCHLVHPCRSLRLVIGGGLGHRDPLLPSPTARPPARLLLLEADTTPLDAPARLPLHTTAVAAQALLATTISLGVLAPQGEVEDLREADLWEQVMAEEREGNSFFGVGAEW